MDEFFKNEKKLTTESTEMENLENMLSFSVCSAYSVVKGYFSSRLSVSR